jgi:hypothetical protein
MRIGSQFRHQTQQTDEISRQMLVLINILILFPYRHIDGALNEFTPDLVVYNAGTDILEGDPLGCLSISPQVSSSSDGRYFEEIT